MAKLCKWGNSVGVRVPQAVLESAQLKVGDECLCRTLDNGTILLTPTMERPGATISGSGKAANSPTKKEPEEKW